CRVAPDRRLRIRGAETERPFGVPGRVLPAPGEQGRLDRADRTTPRRRRRVLPALAPAERRALEPLGGLAGAPEHEQREPRTVGGITDPDELLGREPRH